MTSAWLTPPLIVKVSGSLYDWPELGSRLTAFLGAYPEYQAVLVPGGGAFVDAVRGVDKSHQLGDEVAHWLSNEPAPRQLKINTVITHGWECGVDGSVVFPDGTAYAFSHMVFFTGASKTARVKEVRTYRVPTTVV